MALAAPTGGSVASGTASIVTAGSTMTVTNTPNAIINWASFGIAAGETVKFVQQSAASAVLNRVTGTNPSSILGALQSNGKVFLINPNGIMFGAGAQINVNGLVASTLNLSDADFLAGRMNFNADRATPGSVVNAGNIETPTGGYVYLLAPNIENSGVITTPGGEAILAAGNSVEIVNSTDPSQRVLVSATSHDLNLSQLMTQSNGNIFSVLNSGKVSANTAVQDATGKIYFKSAGNIQTTSTSVVEAKGDINANGGSFIGFADNNGVYAGAFNVSGKNGGFVETSGHTLEIDPGISVKANALFSFGTAGMWMLDPTDILIDAALAASVSSTLSGGTNVTLTTVGGGTDFGDITITGQIISSATSGTPTLFLNADRDIVFGTSGSIEQADIGTSGSFTSNLTAGRDIVFAGTTGQNIYNHSSSGDMSVILNAAGEVRTDSGAFTHIHSVSTGLTIVQLPILKTWTNNGTITLDGNTQIDLDDNGAGSVATLNNNGDITILNNTAGWAFISNSGTQAGIINNNGFFQVIGGTGTSLEALLNNSSSGLVKIQDGTLSVQNAGVLSGAFFIDPGATMVLSETHNGTKTFSGANVYNNGTLSFSVATTFNNSNLYSSGNLSVPTTNVTYTGFNLFNAGANLTVSNTLSTAGGLSFVAGNDINVISGSSITAQDINLKAENGINIDGSTLASTFDLDISALNSVSITNSTLNADWISVEAINNDSALSDYIDSKYGVNAPTTPAMVSEVFNLLKVDATDKVTISNSQLTANDGMDVISNNIVIDNTSNLSATNELIGIALNDIKLNQSSLSSNLEMFLATGGHLYLDNSSHINVNSVTTLYFNFPLLASDGWFVDGVANAFNGSTGSYIRVAGTTPIIGSGFFVTYGGLDLIDDLLGLIDGGLDDPGSSAFVDDSIVADGPTADDFFGTGEDNTDTEEEQKKEEDKPQQCSA